MSYGLDERNAVRQAYVFDRLDLESVAIAKNIPVSTVRRWKREALSAGDDWDEIRSAHTLAGNSTEDLANQFLIDFIVLMQSVKDEILNNPKIKTPKKALLIIKLSDAYHKALNANKKLMPSAHKLAVAMETIERLSDFIAKNKPELLSAFLDILTPFGEQLAQIFESKK